MTQNILSHIFVIGSLTKIHKIFLRGYSFACWPVLWQPDNNSWLLHFIRGLKKNSRNCRQDFLFHHFPKQSKFQMAFPWAFLNIIFCWKSTSSRWDRLDQRGHWVESARRLVPWLGAIAGTQEPGNWMREVCWAGIELVYREPPHGITGVRGQWKRTRQDGGEKKRIPWGW